MSLAISFAAISPFLLYSMWTKQYIIESTYYTFATFTINIIADFKCQIYLFFCIYMVCYYDVLPNNLYISEILLFANIVIRRNSQYVKIININVKNILKNNISRALLSWYSRDNVFFEKWYLVIDISAIYVFLIEVRTTDWIYDYQWILHAHF